MPAAARKWVFGAGLILGLFSGIAVSGQNQFIHIQSEAGQAFGASLNGTDYNSTRTGYLIIPEIGPGSYDLHIFFPDDIHQYSFSFSIGSQPRSFSLKQGIDNAWTLFDMVEFSFIRGSIVAKALMPLQPESPGSAREPEKPQALPSVRIQKIFEKASPAGIDQVYIVVNGNKADTVALFIPALEEPRPATQIAEIGRKPLGNFPYPVSRFSFLVTGQAANPQNPYSKLQTPDSRLQTLPHALLP
ncbi:MAG: hypothetical protein JO301_11640 [Chitinophagaceae bacterium]|nr:hypothetical protein [Chitinophagaceae bacterium]